MPAPVSISTLTLALEDNAATDQQLECQLSRCFLEFNYQETELRSFCGTYTESQESATLNLAGWQDWGGAVTTAITELLWDAVENDRNVDFELVVGGEAFTGSIEPRKLPVGGDGEQPLTFDKTFPVQGAVSKAAAS